MRNAVEIFHLLQSLRSIIFNNPVEDISVFNFCRYLLFLTFQKLEIAFEKKSMSSATQSDEIFILCQTYPQKPR